MRSLYVVQHARLSFGPGRTLQRGNASRFEPACEVSLCCKTPLANIRRSDYAWMFESWYHVVPHMYAFCVLLSHG